jgi:hypothetical protein
MTSAHDEVEEVGEVGDVDGTLIFSFFFFFFFFSVEEASFVVYRFGSIRSRY